MKAIFDSYVALLIAERYRAKAVTLRVYVNMFESEISPLLQKVMSTHPECLFESLRCLTAYRWLLHACRSCLDRY